MHIFTLAVPLKLRIYNPPPLRSQTTSMHSRSTLGKRLLGVRPFGQPLGLPAQKGWEVCSPLPGSHHPRLSEKIVAGSVFINAFIFEVCQPLCTDAAHSGRPTHIRFRLPARKGEDRSFAYRFTPPIGSLKCFFTSRPFFVTAFVAIQL